MTSQVEATCGHVLRDANPDWLISSWCVEDAAITTRKPERDSALRVVPRDWSCQDTKVSEARQMTVLVCLLLA